MSIPTADYVYGTNPEFQLKTLEGAFQAFKKPDPIKYELASKEQHVDTPEGRVSCNPGDAIMTRQDGGSWPIPRKSFDATYLADPEDGTATKNIIPVFVRKMEEIFSVKLSWGKHDVIKGEGGGFLVEYGVGDYGAVGSEEFLRTYALIEAEAASKEMPS